MYNTPYLSMHRACVLKICHGGDFLTGSPRGWRGSTDGGRSWSPIFTNTGVVQCADDYVHTTRPNLSLTWFTFYTNTRATHCSCQHMNGCILLKNSYQHFHEFKVAVGFGVCMKHVCSQSLLIAI